MTITPSIFLTALFTLLTLIPVLSGAGGAFSSALTDLIKAFSISIGKPLPDNWGGKLAIIVNVLVWGGLCIFVTGGQSPDILPKDTIAALQTLTTIAGGFAVLFTQFHLSRLFHGITAKFAPGWFSLSSYHESKKIGAA